jgi:N6-adenosine-specific RNA methylase IME4
MSAPARLIMADPPWAFADKLPGKKRGAVKHYPCMGLLALARFPLPPLADDCLLLMWRVAALQDEASAVMTAWGFTLKSEIVWVKLTAPPRCSYVGKCNSNRCPLHGQPRQPRKLHFGMGRYVRASHETCLLGVRGRVQVADHAVRSVFAASVQEHSRKPDEIYDIAERLVPRGPYIELFARRTRRGWTCLGNDPAVRKQA